MVAIVDGSISASSKKWLDIEITNRWPLIGLGPKASLLRPDAPPLDISGFDHLSVPPDLRLHLSGANRQLMFDASPAWALRDGSSTGYLRWFTFVGKVLDQADFLTGGKHREWFQGVLISPFLDEKSDTARTRVFVDFFLHCDPLPAPIDQIPFALPNMRAAYDRSGCTLGPYRFGTFQRRPEAAQTLLLTIRYGFVELERTEGVFVHTSLAEYRR